MTSDAKRQRRWRREGWVLGLVLGAVLFGLTTLGYTAVNADSAARTADQTLTQVKAELHEMNVTRAQRDQQLVALLDHIITVQANGHEILFQLKADTADIGAFAAEIKSELGAICRADKCVFVISTPGPKSGLTARHGRSP